MMVRPPRIPGSEPRRFGPRTFAPLVLSLCAGCAASPPTLSAAPAQPVARTPVAAPAAPAAAPLAVDLVTHDSTRPEPWLARALVDELRRRQVTVRDAAASAPDGARLVLRVAVGSRSRDEGLIERRPSSATPPSRLDETEGPPRTGFPDELDPDPLPPPARRSERAAEDFRVRIRVSLWRAGAAAPIATSVFDEGAMGISPVQSNRRGEEWKIIYSGAAARIANWLLASAPRQ